jgi:hypothetical protein
MWEHAPLGRFIANGWLERPFHKATVVATEGTRPTMDGILAIGSNPSGVRAFSTTTLSGGVESKVGAPRNVCILRHVRPPGPAG